METPTQQPHPQHPLQTRNKHLGNLLLLVAIVLAWIITPPLMGMQEEASLKHQQLQQQYDTLSLTLTQKQGQLKEYQALSETERKKVTGAIPEKGKASQPNILREIESILTGTSAKLRGISFDNSTFSQGTGPKAIPITLELESPDAGTILQILKKFEDSTRLYREEAMTLTSAESGISAQVRLNVYSRE